MHTASCGLGWTGVPPLRNPTFPKEDHWMSQHCWNWPTVSKEADSLEKTLMLGKIEDRRGRGWQRMSWLDTFPSSMDMHLSKLQDITEGQKSLAHYSPWNLRESDTTSQLNNNPKEAAFSSAQKSERVQLEVEEVGSQGAGPGTSGSRVQREAWRKFSSWIIWKREIFFKK